MKLQGFSNKKAWVALWAGGALVAATTVFAGPTGNTIGPSFTPPPSTKAPQKVVDQKKSQQDTQDKNEKGADLAQLLGMASIGLGSMLIQQGTPLTQQPETTPQGMQMILQGAAAILQGLQALQAKDEMKKNAAAAAYNAGQVDAFNPGVVNSLADNMKIDPSFLREGDLGKIMDGFENSTGIPRDYLATALENGIDPFDLLAKSPKGNIDKNMLSQAKGKAEEFIAGGGKVDLSKYGVDPETMAASIGDPGYGSGGGRGLASAKSTKPDFDSLFGSVDQGALAGGGGVDTSQIGISPDVEKALGRAGISEKSIFQMVSSRYKARTPFLFGVEEKKNIDLKDPFETSSGTQANRGGVL